MAVVARPGAGRGTIYGSNRSIQRLRTQAFQPVRAERGSNGEFGEGSEGRIDPTIQPRRPSRRAPRAAEPEANAEPENKKEDEAGATNNKQDVYMYLRAARIFKLNKENFTVSTPKAAAVYAIENAFKERVREEDRNNYMNLANDASVTDQERSQILLVYLLSGAVQKLLLKQTQNDERKKDETSKFTIPVEYVADRNPRSARNEFPYRFDKTKADRFENNASPKKDPDRVEADAFERLVARSFENEERGMQIVTTFMERKKAGKRHHLLKEFKKAVRDDRNRDAILFGILQTAANELAGLSFYNRREKGVSSQRSLQDLLADGEVNKNYLSYKRRVSEEEPSETVKRFKDYEYRKRLNEEARQKKVKAGTEQSVSNREEALGGNLDGVGAKYIFPAPTKPNTSTRPGQTCISNVDRTSGLTIAEFKDMKVVIPKGVLLGFTPGTLNGQYLIHEYAESLPEFRQQLRDNPEKPGSFLKAEREVEKRKQEYAKWKERNPNGSKEQFAQSFYENRNKKYKKSIKGADRKRQSFKTDVLQYKSQSTGGLATAQTKAGKKAAKIRKQAKRTSRMEPENADQGGPAPRRDEAVPAPPRRLSGPDPLSGRALADLEGYVAPDQPPPQEAAQVNGKRKRTDSKQKGSAGKRQKQSGENLQKMTVPQLQTILQNLGETNLVGKKSSLITRIKKLRASAKK